MDNNTQHKKRIKEVLKETNEYTSEFINRFMYMQTLREEHKEVFQQNRQEIIELLNNIVEFLETLNRNSSLYQTMKSKQSNKETTIDINKLLEYSKETPHINNEAPIKLHKSQQEKLKKDISKLNNIINKIEEEIFIYEAKVVFKNQTLVKLQNSTEEEIDKLIFKTPTKSYFKNELLQENKDIKINYLYKNNIIQIRKLTGKSSRKKIAVSNSPVPNKLKRNKNKLKNFEGDLSIKCKPKDINIELINNSDNPALTDLELMVIDAIGEYAIEKAAEKGISALKDKEIITRIIFNEEPFLLSISGIGKNLFPNTRQLSKKQQGDIEKTIDDLRFRRALKIDLGKEFGIAVGSSYTKRNMPFIDGKIVTLIEKNKKPQNYLRLDSLPIIYIESILRNNQLRADKDKLYNIKHLDKNIQNHALSHWINHQISRCKNEYNNKKKAWDNKKRKDKKEVKQEPQPENNLTFQRMLEEINEPNPTDKRKRTLKKNVEIILKHYKDEGDIKDFKRINHAYNKFHGWKIQF